MNDNATAPGRPPSRNFQAEIYRDLDRKLKNSRWNSGASEAHGLLTALACRGVSGERLRTRAWLFRLSEKPDIDLIEGMYALILRDLRSEGFEFNLLLADDGFSDAQRIESVTDWCGGFIQGFFHEAWGKAHEPSMNELDGFSERVRESVNDIMEISRVTFDTQAADDTFDATERQLFEIQEYLRVAIQVLFEELNPKPKNPTVHPTETN